MQKEHTKRVSVSIGANCPQTLVTVPYLGALVPMSPKGYPFVPNRPEYIVVYGTKAEKSTVRILKSADNEI